MLFLPVYSDIYSSVLAVFSVDRKQLVELIAASLENCQNTTVNVRMSDDDSSSDEFLQSQNSAKVSWLAARESFGHQNSDSGILHLV